MSAVFDYVIIGSGTAGSVLANRLSEDRDASVCILEAGPRDLNPFIHIPAGFMKTLVNPAINWLYQTEPSEGSGGRAIAQPRGKTLGGSSSINGHIYNRGQRMDFDVWAQRGNRGWSYVDVLPYFKRSERRIGDGDDTFRGRDGNVVITDLDWSHPLCDAFIDGAVGMGIPRNPDYNGATQDGVGYFQRSVYKRRRMSSARANLHPAANRQNLEVRTLSLADKILIEGKRAVGVRYQRDGRTEEVKARREIILSGGTFNSPQLLQLSGIGPPQLLRELGIRIEHALPGVGENLRDHYPVRSSARVKKIETINERSRGFKLAAEIMKYFCGFESILNLQPTLVHVFWRSDPHIESSDLQLTFTPASYMEGVQSTLDDFPGMTVAAWQQRPESIGHVHIRSADPHEKPLIQPNYLKDEIDRRCLIGGIKLARKLFRTPELQPYFDGEDAPGEPVKSDDEILAYARQRGTTAFHPMGTCRMGPGSDPSTVVNDQLQVHGIQGLRVVDASIMPTMPSANTNASTLMIGEKGADLIRGRPALPATNLHGK